MCVCFLKLCTLFFGGGEGAEGNVWVAGQTLHACLLSHGKVHARSWRAQLKADFFMAWCSEEYIAKYTARIDVCEDFLL